LYSQLVGDLVFLVVGVLPLSLVGEVRVVSKLTASLSPSDRLTFVVTPENSGVKSEVVQESVEGHDINRCSPVPGNFHFIYYNNLNLINDKYGKLYRSLTIL
jgi:hypothetical protein